ncbi:hypothetical protein JTB14_016442 [Gonioctena quinquepunctata]|nr:hypothetical protein JTB14_016442 [Gonioctena quinquepunctata]
MDKIDIKFLLSLVEERPALWDKTSELYKDKIARDAAWREICVILDDEFDELEPKERQEFSKLVTKKWGCVRDSWMKCAKRQNEHKMSGSSRPYRHYLYHDHMRFLEKLIDFSTTQEDEESTEECKIEIKPTRVSTPHETRLFTSERKRKQDVKRESDAKIMNISDIPTDDYENNRHLSFFKSILPSLSSFSDDQTLEFQAGIISLLQQIKQKYTWIPSSTSTYPTE